VRTAFSHLLEFSLKTNDWLVFNYLIGRGALWAAVLTALWSMYDYFAYFFRENKKRKAAAPPAFDEAVPQDRSPGN
jgi:hypothetical protein